MFAPAPPRRLDTRAQRRRRAVPGRVPLERGYAAAGYEIGEVEAVEATKGVAAVEESGLTPHAAWHGLQCGLP